MLMTREQFKARTKAYALRVIQAIDALPRNEVGKVLLRELVALGRRG